MKDSLEAWKGYLDCYARHAEQERKSGMLRKPVFVTLSRQAGAGAITITNRLLEIIKEKDRAGGCPWQIVYRDLAERVVSEHDLPKEVAKFMPEQKTSELRDYIESMLELHPPAFSLFKKMARTILQLAQMGNVIIVGRGANVITRRLGGLHVRIVGSIVRRRHHLQEYFGWDEKTAGKELREKDKARKEFMKQNFGRDIDDPLLYDLVINTDIIGYEEAARIIADSLLRMKAD